MLTVCTEERSRVHFLSQLVQCGRNGGRGAIRQIKAGYVLLRVDETDVLDFDSDIFISAGYQKSFPIMRGGNSPTQVFQ